MTPEEAATRFEPRTLVEAYAFAVDARDKDRLVGLFVPEGAMALGQHELQGPDLVKAIDMLNRHYPRSMHFVGNHDVVLDGDAATGRVYCIAHHIFADGEENKDRSMAIHYDDRYLKRDDGWRFARRDLTIIWEEERPASLG